MKWIILLAIRVYWLVPVELRRSCLFKESCSHFVFRSTKEKGFFCGIRALMLRIKQCRPGYKFIFSDTGSIKMQLIDGSIVEEAELSDKLKNEVKNFKNVIPH